MKKRAIAIVVAVFLVGGGALIVKKRKELANEAPPQVMPMVVEALNLQKSGPVMLTLPTVADVQPLRDTNLSSRLTAYITSIPLYEGERFVRGEPLAKLELSQAQADLQRAEASLAQTRLQENTLAADLAASASALDAEQQRYGRTLALYGIQGVSLEQLQTARANLATVKAREESSRAAMDGYKSLLRANSSAVNAARKNLDYGAIVAPFDGVVAQRLAQPGDLATPGKALLRIIDTSAGNRLLVNLPSGLHPVGLIFGGRTFPLAPWPEALSNGMRRYEARGVKGAFLPGSRIDTKVVIYQSSKATLIPGRCLLSNNGRAASILVLEKGRADSRPLVVAAQGEEGVATEEGALKDALIACGSPDILARLESGTPFELTPFHR